MHASGQATPDRACTPFTHTTVNVQACWSSSGPTLASLHGVANVSMCVQCTSTPSMAALPELVPVPVLALVARRLGTPSKLHCAGTSPGTSLVHPLGIACQASLQVSQMLEPSLAPSMTLEASMCVLPTAGTMSEPHQC